MKIKTISGETITKVDTKTLRGYDFSGQSLRYAFLQSANLVGANFEGADLEGADLTGANLEGANLEGSWMYFANFRHANLNNANLCKVSWLPLNCYEQRALRMALYGLKFKNQTEVSYWACKMAGPLGRYLEREFGTFTAAHLLLGGKTRPVFQLVKPGDPTPTDDHDDILQLLLWGEGEL